MRAWSSLVAFGVALLGVSLTSSCQNLEPIEQGCGNLVVEVGEDCDGTFASVASGAECGLPGDDNACRFLCNELGVGCPSGFRCDPGEGVCRKPRGLFEPAGASLAGSTEPLHASDLDQDGVEDLMVTSPSALSAYYFDGDLQVQQIETVAVRSRDEAVGKLQNKQRQDLALLVDGSGEDVPGYLALLETSVDGTFQPLPFSSIALDFENVSSQTRFQTVDTFFGETVARVDDAAGIGVLDENFQALNLYSGTALLNQGGGQFAGIAFGNPVPESNPCDFAAVARDGAPAVVLLPLCRYDPAGESPPWMTTPGPDTVVLIPLPNGAEVAAADPNENAVVKSRVRWGDVNDDDIDDLLVQAVCDGGVDCLLIGYGKGTATPTPMGPPLVLDSPAPVPVPNEVGDIDALADSCSEDIEVRGFLLAIADFNDDQLADIATTHGIYLSVDSGPTAESVYIDYEQVLCLDPGTQETGGFREVETEDINQDGTIDFVAREVRPGQGNEGEVSVYLNDGDGFFGKYPIADRASFFEVEDVDGDGLDDVVVFSEVDGGDADTFEGFVSYGRSSAGPEPPISIGRLTGVNDLIAGRFVGNDAPNDILVVREENDAISTTILFGSTSRLIVAPFLFVEPGVKDPRQAERPLTMAIGNFDGTGPSMVVLTDIDDEVADDYALWHLTLGEALTPEPQPFPFDDFSLDDGLAVALDVEGDGRDELMIATADGIVLFHFDGSGISKIESWPYEEETTQVKRLTGRPVVTDLDGDGAQDVVVALGRELALLVWNDGGLNPVTSGVALPVPTSDEGENASLPVFTTLDLDGDGPDDLVLANETGVWKIPMAGRTIGNPVRLAGIEGGNTLTAADFNGDGLVDLAVGDRSATRVYQAVDSPGFEAIAAALADNGPSQEPGPPVDP